MNENFDSGVVGYLRDGTIGCIDHGTHGLPSQTIQRAVIDVQLSA